MGSREEIPASNDEIEAGNLLSTGSTTLNLAISNNPHGAFLPGRYYFVVGDSSSGKTFVTLTCFAESTSHPLYKDYELYYDGAEFGNNIDMVRFFGEKTAARVKPPRVDENGVGLPSFTIEDFYDNVWAALGRERPMIYVLDSMDALTSEQEVAKAESDKKAREEGNDYSGIMTDGKAKINSQRLRPVVNKLGVHGSILIILNQTRDSMAKFGPKKTRSGGRALKFYATVEIWTSRKSTINQTVRGSARQVGIVVEAECKKNRITGGEHTVEFPIYHSYGIDDIGSCIEYLITEGTFPKVTKQSIEPKGLLGVPQITPAKLAEMVSEDADLLYKLRDMCGQTWNEIIALSSLKRKPRYE